MGSNPSTLTLFCYSAGKKLKEWINIVQISKNEAAVLNKKYGIPYGECGIAHTYTKSRKYYLCERSFNMNALEKIRKIQTVG